MTECDSNVIVMLDQYLINVLVVLDPDERIYPATIVALDQYKNTYLPT